MVQIFFCDGFMSVGHGLIDAKNGYFIFVASGVNIHLYASIEKGNSY